MSILILKPGLLDTFQDRGRHGHAHLGIPVSGALDEVALTVGNSLVGNAPDEAALEMHFPAPVIRFETDALIALAGADFGACLDGQLLPLHTPVWVGTGATLDFRRPAGGARCYLALRGGFPLEPWLDSCSTLLAATAGGWQGRALQAGDRIPFRAPAHHFAVPAGKHHAVFPWRADVAGLYRVESPLRFCPGAEYAFLGEHSKTILETADWRIGRQSDRMGCRVEGRPLALREPLHLVSSAVAPGTIQLLPNGQCVVLLADSQTTGGYPRIGHMIRADLPALAQLLPGAVFRLQQVDVQTAVQAWSQQNQRLGRLRRGCLLKCREFFS